MWNRFTKAAKLVVSAAREEAARLGSEYVRTEHILLGLCKLCSGPAKGDIIAAQALDNLGMDIAALAAETERRARDSQKEISWGKEIPFAPRAKKAVELANEESRRFDHNYIDALHLLLGLVKEGEGTAAKVLRDNGVDLDGMESQVVRLLDDQGTNEEQLCRRPEHLSEPW